MSQSQFTLLQHAATGLARSRPAAAGAAGEPTPWVGAMEAALGFGKVAADRPTRETYARSTTGEPTPPSAVVYPTATAQVQAVVRIANEHGLALYPIACGKNWGYGDARANTAGQVIVDLSGMNRIIEVSDDLAYTVIEPGVTQGQLADYLVRHHPGLWCDVTGAGRDASLVGNTLDRGFGHTPYGDHARNSCGMSVVLADGSLLHTGMERFAESRTRHVYSHGVGPQLEGLFAQSNLGIVTQMGLWLVPRPRAFCAFFLMVDERTALAPVVDRLASLRRRGLLTSAVHIGNDLRVLSSRMRYPWNRAEGETPLPEALRAELRREYGVSPWNIGGGIYGTPGTIRAVKRELRRAAGREATVRFVDERRLARAERLHRLLTRFGRGERLGQKLRWLKPVYGLMRGEPSDEPLWGALWRVREPIEGAAREAHQPPDPLAAHAGLRWVSPVLPNTGRDADYVRQVVEPIYAAFGFEPLITFTMISERAMIAVTNLAFDTREPEETERAAQCYEALNTALMEAGYVPYRAGPAGQERLADAAPTFTEVAGRLKHALDPDHTLAPGRYIPGPAQPHLFKQTARD